MRNDVPPPPEAPASIPEGFRASGGSKLSASAAGLVRGAIVLALIGGTSWVIAGRISAYLVPLYLLVMALILLPVAPARSDRDRATAGGSGRGGAAPDGSPGSGSASIAATAPEAPPAAESVAPADPAPAAKRGRGRPRKPKAPAKAAAEPVAVVPATWVEVGPGKFVRVEGAEPPAPASDRAGPTLDAEVADRDDAVGVTPAEPGPSAPAPIGPALGSIDLGPISPAEATKVEPSIPGDRDSSGTHAIEWSTPTAHAGPDPVPLPVVEAPGDRAFSDVGSAPVVAESAEREAWVAPRRRARGRSTGRSLGRYGREDRGHGGRPGRAARGRDAGARRSRSIPASARSRRVGRTPHAR